MFHRLFFQGKASYIKRLCAWLNILSNHRSQSDQARYSCTLWTFLWTFPRHTSSFLTVLLSVERRSGLLGLCAGLAWSSTARPRSTYTPNPAQILPYTASWEGRGRRAQIKKGTKWQHRKNKNKKQETQRPSLSPSPSLHWCLRGTGEGEQD